MRRLVAILVLGALVIGGARAWVAWHERDDPFRLDEPRPATIRELGQAKPPPMHDCTSLGRCFDYVGGWCQAPCATYRVEGTITSIRRVRDSRYGGFLIVLRDGDATIAARARLFRKWEAGDRVRVSGVLFFPRRARDGRHAANGAELSPVLRIAPL